MRELEWWITDQPLVRGILISFLQSSLFGNLVGDNENNVCPSLDGTFAPCTIGNGCRNPGLTINPIADDQVIRLLSRDYLTDPLIRNPVACLGQNFRDADLATTQRHKDCTEVSPPTCLYIFYLNVCQWIFLSPDINVFNCSRTEKSDHMETADWTCRKLCITLKFAQQPHALRQQVKTLIFWNI